MKINRQKQVKRTLNIYKNTYRFREPFLVLPDGTFCQAAVTHKVEIKKRLSAYLGATAQCCTTKCILSELELLGSGMFSARMVAQRFQLRDCKHKTPVTASECIMSLVHNKYKIKYFVASQDPSLSRAVRSHPGIPLLYLYRNVVVLEKPSDVTVKDVKTINEKKMSGNEVFRLKEMKKKAGLSMKEILADSQIKKKKKRGKRKIR